MKVWITTDTHFNHAKIIEYGRPADYEERIYKGLEVVGKEDILIHLGDFCIGNDEACHKEFMSKVKGRKILVVGNHDRKSYTWYLEHGWDFVCDMFYWKAFGQHILLSHTPKSKRSINFWNYNVHGHLHDNLHRFPEYLKLLTPKHLLISLEKINYQPVLLETLIGDAERKAAQESRIKLKAIGEDPQIQLKQFVETNPPRCLKCGEPMKNHIPDKGRFKGEVQTHSWVCKCTPNLILSIG